MMWRISDVAGVVFWSFIGVSLYRESGITWWLIGPVFCGSLHLFALVAMEDK